MLLLKVIYYDLLLLKLFIRLDNNLNSVYSCTYVSVIIIVPVRKSAFLLAQAKINEHKKAKKTKYRETNKTKNKIKIATTTTKQKPINKTIPMLIAFL